MNFLNTTMHNVSWFHKRYQNDELTLKAPFQRNPVWTTKQKSYLIDTILRGYPIPELYIQEFADGDGNEQYIVVDGQQRVRACMEFIAGGYEIVEEKDNEEWAGLNFDDLTEAQRKKIFNYNFVVRVLPEMEDDKIRAIFKRLNRYVIALNTQELRHATYWGEFISCVEKISDNENWSLLGVFTPNDVRRMNDIEYVSELAVGHIHGVQNKKISLDKWYEAYEETFPDKRSLEKTFPLILDTIVDLFPEISYTRWRKKSDFYSLFLALAENKKILPLTEGEKEKLAEALENFSDEVTKYLRDNDYKPTHDVKQYAVAVERAASDLANRRTRRDIILKIIESTLG
ncbi:DUF262 domain-containing protein [Methylobacterium sp. Leaf100]|uniref:DUF262 domain-containing protein n=1 Tax=Methylobacterium sp. Leaf100 TaxID=1736252 RepID=UPI0009EA6B40|nr:DUF262 domain-containing protein [Methylobacterium sp. Leaf100]